MFVGLTPCGDSTGPMPLEPLLFLGSLSAIPNDVGTVYTFRRTPSRSGRGRRAAVDFVVCFGCGGISCFFFLVFLRHTACCKHEVDLPHITLYYYRGGDRVISCN